MDGYGKKDDRNTPGIIKQMDHGFDTAVDNFLKRWRKIALNPNVNRNRFGYLDSTPDDTMMALQPIRWLMGMF